MLKLLKRKLVNWILLLIKENLISQLTSPVLWTQTINNMISENINLFIECGPGKVLQGLVKKINRDIKTESII